MARTYKRDSRGRFAGGGGGGGGGGRPAARKAPRGTNRLTRDNAGKITGTGNGATARGGRLRTAGGLLRATQTARLKGGGTTRAGGGAKMKGERVGGTVAKPRGLKPQAVKAKRKATAQKANVVEAIKTTPRKTRQNLLSGTGLALRLGRVETRAKAVEMRSRAVIVSNKTNKKNDASYKTAKKALAFLSKVGTHSRSTFNQRPTLSTTKRRGHRAVAALSRAMNRKGVLKPSTR